MALPVGAELYAARPSGVGECSEMFPDGSGLCHLLRVEPGRGVESPARSNAATLQPPDTARSEIELPGGFSDSIGDMA